MKGHIKIGKVFGIQLGLHFSWLVAPMVIAPFLTGQFSAGTADWGSTLIWMTTFITGLLFVVTVIFHEVVLALVARMARLPARSITQLALGGIELDDKETDNAVIEFVVGTAGPIISLTIGVFCLLLAVVLGWSPQISGATPPTPLLASIVWLGSINIVWALFNTIPAFPLDGGRVLRAVLWWRNDKKERSKLIAARVGQFAATFFLVCGAFQLLLGGNFNGVWFVLIGAFLLTTARGSYEPLRDIRIISPLLVDDLMQRDCEIVQGQIDLQVFVNDHLLKTGNQYYFVAENNRLAGMITPEEVMKMRHGEWTNKTVGQVMCTLDNFQIVAPQMPIAKAYETMSSAEVNQLPVASNNQLMGIITRDDILKNLYTHVISEN